MPKLTKAEKRILENVKRFELIDSETGETVDTLSVREFNLHVQSENMLQALIIGQRACQALANEYNDQDQTKLSASWQKHADELNAVIAKAKGA